MGIRGLEEERRVVTLLAADLVGSTALGEQLDPEEVRLVVGDAVARIVRAVEALGGTVKDLAGDGVFAFFGAPTAHEDDPERAVQAALRITEEIAAYAVDVERGWGVRGFAVRVGVVTGPVVVGPVGAGSRIEYGATGDAANTAARLQAAAAPGTVLVDEATRRLVEPLFRWGETEPLALKGKSEPVPATPALARVSTDGRRRRGDAPLVGRERELAAAREALAGVLAGAGGVLFVTGEPGIGKSRLLAELRREFVSAGSPGGRPLWLEGRAASYSDTVPYAPFQHLLREWLGIAAGEPELRVRVALRRASSELFGARAGDVDPWLGTVLGLAPDGGRDELRPQALRRRAFEAVETLLARLAGDGPVVVALDDLQWADATSLELVEHLLSLPDREPVLLVLAQRVEREHGSWQLHDRALREVPHRTSEVALVPLTAETDGELLAALVGQGTLPADVQGRLLAAAGGNPFFLEELLRSLQDAGALLAGADGTWRLARDDFAIPGTVQNVILARLDRLAPEIRLLLTAASVLGRQFALPLLEAVAAVDAADGLRELQRLDLVRETRRWPDREYGFRHALIQETAYRSLVAERRKALHARAAAALASLFADRLEEQAAILAHHLLEAGQLEPALAHLHAAGEAAARVYATEEGLEHYGKALDVAARVGAGGAAVAELRLRRGLVAYRAGRFAEARADYEAALERARKERERGLELRALEELGWLLLGARVGDAIARLEEALAIARELDDDAARARLLSRLAVASSHALAFAEAHRFSDEALRLARPIGDDRLLATALDSAKTVAVHLGDFATARSILDELEEVLRRGEDAWYLQWAVLDSALPLMADGRLPEAAAAIEGALDLNRRIGDSANEPYFLAALGWLHRAGGEYGSALACGRRAAELAAAHGHRSWIAWTEALLGCTLIELHAFGEAVERLRPALHRAEQGAAPLYVFRCAAHLAVAERCAGDHAAASATAAHAERLLAAVSTPPGTTFLHGADAVLAVAGLRAEVGALVEAEELAGPLVAAAERSGWPEPVAAGSRLLARLRLAAGDEAGCERRLEQALAAAGGGGLPGEERQAHAALAELLAIQGRGVEAAAHGEAAERLLERLGATIDEDAVRRAFQSSDVVTFPRRLPLPSVAAGTIPSRSEEPWQESER